MMKLATLAVVAIAGATALSSGELVLTRRQAYVMGTRVDMSAFGRDRADGRNALERALTSLEETDAELSTWKGDSDISAINRSPIGQPRILRPMLCRLFAELYEWESATSGTFDPGIGAITDAWGIHEEGRTPTDRELRAARARSGLRFFDFNRSRCSVARRVEATIDVGAFGKGEALDRAAAALNSLPWVIDLGGQVSVNAVPPGRTAWTVRIADPRDRARAVMTVKLRSGSLSTSAGSERDHHVRNARIGHILDPRTGTPASYDGSVVVWHERALVADILSTALYVMGPREGPKWAESRGIAAAYLVPKGGRIRTVTTTMFARLEPTTEPE